MLIMCIFFKFNEICSEPTTGDYWDDTLDTLLTSPRNNNSIFEFSILKIPYLRNIMFQDHFFYSIAIFNIMKRFWKNPLTAFQKRKGNFSN